MPYSEENFIPVILAGGSGNRLWPLSRKSLPKQFLKIFDGKCLFEKTLDRLKKLDSQNIRIKNYDFPYSIILEPESRNTAAAIGIASMYIKEEFKKATLLVLSSDHFISNELLFARSIKKSLSSNLIDDDSFFIFGCEPTFASTEYGYIKKEDNNHSDYLFEASSFKEKPDVKNANLYFDSKEYLWNCGIFIFRNKLLIEFFKNFKSYNQLLNDSWANKELDLSFIRPEKKYFEKLKNISIDYLLIENASMFGYKIFCSKLLSNWDDLGSWLTISKYIKDKPKPIQINSTNNIVVTDNKTTLVDISNLLIFQDKEYLFIADKNNLKNNYKAINNVIKKFNNEKDNDLFVYRPWGFYQIIDVGSDFLAKKITVYAKSRLSLQKHRFRTEHWVVLHGNATVVIEENIFYLSANKSIDIPVNKKHRLINDTDEVLVIIEIQTGTKLSEDDIVRYNDDYGRN